MQVNDICQLFMLLVIRSAEHDGSHAEARRHREEFRRRWGDPDAAYARLRAESLA